MNLPSETRHADALIVGQGLAGSTLAWRLAERGLRPIVIDRGSAPSVRPAASRVAAGLVTPITGKRLTLAPDWGRCWPVARDFYRSVERATGATLLAERPAIRLLAGAEERALLDQRLADPVYARHVRLLDPAEVPAGLSTPHGAFAMRPAGRLDTSAYLDSTRRWLEGRGAYRQASIAIDREVEYGPDGVAVPSLGLSAERIFLCLGHAVAGSRWLDGVTLAPAKGEILTIETGDLRLSQVAHRGVWIAPEGGGRFRVGATHEWERLDSEPTPAGREELLRRLRGAYGGPLRVVDHQAAVRPATPDRRPLAGFHPDEPRVGWLNGLGAKGTLWAPVFAARLAEACVSG